LIHQYANAKTNTSIKIPLYFASHAIHYVLDAMNPQTFRVPNVKAQQEYH
jgi:hypothetical protein